MALDVLIGGTNLDANLNLKTTLPATKSQAGFATIQVENDSGSIIGSRHLHQLFVSEQERLAIGLDTVLGVYNFTSNSQNTGDFKHIFGTMTMTQSAGFLNINPGLATVSGNFAALQTWRHFAIQGDAGIQVEMILQISAIPPANQILEFGLFLAPATGIAPADGVFFRLTSAGFACIMSYNGVEVSSGVVLVSPPVNANAEYQIIVDQRQVSFWIDGILYAEISVPAAQAVPFLSLSLPMCQMMRNSGTVSGGAIVKVGANCATMMDMHATKPWSEQMATQGNAYQGQEGDTMGQLAIWANASSPGAVALSNTAAAFVGLGGIAQVTVSLAAATDGIIFSYQNPQGTMTLPAKTLVVTGITLCSVVSVVLAATALVYAYAAAFGHTSVSLATTEGASFSTATTKAPRRSAIGMDGYLSAAAVGTRGNTLSIKFASPIVVNPGEFFQIIAKALIAAPATGALVITANVDHYFE